MTVKRNANFERDLARQIERSVSKISIPIEVSGMNVEALDDDCRRILLRLDEHDKDSPGWVDYPDMAKWLGLPDEIVGVAYDRLKQFDLINLIETFSEPKAAYILRKGRIAADDLRKLPEKQRQRETVEAKLRRRERWSFHYEKLVLPIVLMVVGLIIGWIANSAWNSGSSQHPGNSTSKNVEGSP